jgi:hypothetical protein
VHQKLGGIPRPWEPPLSPSVNSSNILTLIGDWNNVHKLAAAVCGADAFPS